MTAPVQDPARILRKRFGAWIKQAREERNHTQASAAKVLDFGWPAMVSQIERGASAVPSHDIRLWAEVLGIPPSEMAERWLYYIEPAIYHALYGQDPYALEKIPRPQRTVNSAPGRPRARPSEKPE
ncbi:helix-turn-helix domain-containing protein [Variovorax paradoxus]|uniref:helix-turn-helix domain-containing protein n=1 Tax=Variovorax paradoxus TaxID=34073 RepID=UPI003868506B